MLVKQRVSVWAVLGFVALALPGAAVEVTGIFEREG